MHSNVKLRTRMRSPLNIHMTKLTYVLTGIAISILWARASAARSQEVAELETVKTILAAWQDRPTRVKSFQFRCEIGQPRYIRRQNEIADTFELNDLKEKSDEFQLLAREFTFNMTSNKLSYVETGDGWDEATSQKRPRRLKATFDGSFNKQILEEGPIPFGEIAKATRPADILTVFVNIKPVLLVYNPIVQLERNSYHPDEMRILDAHANYKGTNCIRLNVPRGTPKRGKRSNWHGEIYVDPSRSFIPIRFLQINIKEDVCNELSLEYVPDTHTGWRVSGWTEKQFGKNGLEDTIAGRVVFCSFNQFISDDIFALKFPPGAHVVERNGMEVRYFIAKGGEKRKYISESGFGRLPH